MALARGLPRTCESGHTVEAPFGDLASTDTALMDESIIDGTLYVHELRPADLVTRVESGGATDLFCEEIHVGLPGSMTRCHVGLGENRCGSAMRADLCFGLIWRDCDVYQSHGVNVDASISIRTNASGSIGVTVRGWIGP